MMVGLDPRDPNAANQLWDMQGTISNHYAAAVARGIMTTEEAERATEDSRSGMVTDFYLKQAGNLHASQIGALHSQMSKDYSEGKLKGVKAGDWEKIDAGLAAAEKLRQASDRQSDDALRQRGDDIANRILRGQPVEPSVMAALRTDAGTAPHGAEIVASTEARMRFVSALRTKPIGEVEAKIADILKSANAEDTAFARAKLDEVRKQLAVDPIGVAEQFGIVKAVPGIPMDGSVKPEQLRDALAYRRGAAAAAASHFGIPERYFRPGEIETIARTAMNDPDKMVAFVVSARDAFGKDAPRALAEISSVGPVMAHAVGVSLATGDTAIAIDAARITKLKADKQFLVKMPEAAATARIGSSFLGGALSASPETQSAALQTAQLLFEKYANDLGFDATQVKESGSDAEKYYLKALDRSVGGQVLNGVEYGGIATVNDISVIVPADMPKDRPEALLYGLTQRQLAQLPPVSSINGVDVSVEQIRSGHLVSVGDGQYRVALGDPQGDDPQYLINPAGRPWVLDIRELDKMDKAARAGKGPLDYLPLGYTPTGAY